MKKIFMNEFKQALPTYGLIITVTLFIQMAMVGFVNNGEHALGLNMMFGSGLSYCLLIAIGLRLTKTFFTSQKEIVLSMPVNLRGYVFVRYAIDIVCIIVATSLSDVAGTVIGKMSGIDIVSFGGNVMDWASSFVGMFFMVAAVYISVITAALLVKKRSHGILTAVGVHVVINFICVRVIGFVSDMVNANVYSDTINEMFKHTGTFGIDMDGLAAAKTVGTSMVNVINNEVFVNTAAVLACGIIAALFVVLSGHLTENKVEV